jgi:hypothetical protein
LLIIVGGSNLLGSKGCYRSVKSLTSPKVRGKKIDPATEDQDLFGWRSRPVGDEVGYQLKLIYFRGFNGNWETKLNVIFLA